MNKCPYCGATCNLKGFFYLPWQHRTRRASYLCSGCGQVSEMERQDYGCFSIILSTVGVVGVFFIRDRYGWAGVLGWGLMLALVDICFRLFLCRLRPTNQTQNRLSPAQPSGPADVFSPSFVPHCGLTARLTLALG